MMETASVDDQNYMLIWIAVQGLSPDEALSSLEMEFTESGDARDVPGWPDFINRRDYRDRIFMGQLRDGWLLLFGNLDEEQKDRLLQLARSGPAFAGDISRIGNFAEGRRYEGGQEVWKVDYDLENSGQGNLLTVEGRLPAKLAVIIDEAYATEKSGHGSDLGVDVFFEVPGKLSKAVSGFSPHEDPPAGFRWSMLQRIGGEPEPRPLVLDLIR